jgi:hypothetical protein
MLQSFVNIAENVLKPILDICMSFLKFNWSKKEIHQSYWNLSVLPIKNNINIGPEVRLKKNVMFHFLREICTVTGHDHLLKIEFRCSRRVISSCSTSGTWHVTLIKHLLVSHKWGYGSIVIMTKGIYLWSFVTYAKYHLSISNGL